MKGFKLIALKTGAEKKRFITIPNSKNKIDPYKVLKQNTVYPFYSNFTFPSNNFNEIDIDDKELIDLFSTTIDSHSLSVNINAIVGKNGSGKSSLIELLYLATYNIGCRLKLLRDPNTNRVLTPFKELELQLFYSIDNKFFLVNLLDGFVSKKEYILKNNKLTIDAEVGKQFTVFDFKEYFYTITINYSHYALNDLEVGRWVNSLFHKNDGYQTPIVLNPMRVNGNIDMLRENRLLKRRLQANLLQNIKDQDPKLSLRNIANGKIAKTIEIIYNSGKLQGYELEAQYNSEIRNKVVSSIEDAFGFQIARQDLDSNLFTNICINYICSKLLKIATYYRPYHKYFNEVDDKKFLRNINALIKDVRRSNSHIFFKVKGAILYLKYYDWLLGDIKDINSKKNELLIEDYAIKIQKIIDEESVFVNTYMLAPPSFFDTDIILEDGSSIDSLSSGEKQKVHSVSSIIYHIINLNSVSDYNRKIDPESRFHSYNYLNIVLDEIELYYHPEWQRTYIYDLLNSISRINKSNISFIKGLNISFLTHSPYILSDIPVSNVLKLDLGVPVSSLNAPQTYGANIYDLLTDSFFLGKYYIGEKARLDIEKIINTLRSTKDKIIEPYFSEKPQETKKRIEIISEDFLRTKLLQMYFNKYENDKAYQRELLLKQLRDLEN
jgi:hypothetical protein